MEFEPIQLQDANVGNTSELVCTLNLQVLQLFFQGNNIQVLLDPWKKMDIHVDGKLWKANQSKNGIL